MATKWNIKKWIVGYFMVFETDRTRLNLDELLQIFMSISWELLVTYNGLGEAAC